MPVPERFPLLTSPPGPRRPSFCPGVTNTRPFFSDFFRFFSVLKKHLKNGAQKTNFGLVFGRPPDPLFEFASVFWRQNGLPERFSGEKAKMYRNQVLFHTIGGVRRPQNRLKSGPGRKKTASVAQIAAKKCRRVFPSKKSRFLDHFWAPAGTPTSR